MVDSSTNFHEPPEVLDEVNFHEHNTALSSKIIGFVEIDFVFLPEGQKIVADIGFITLK